VLIDGGVEEDKSRVNMATATKKMNALSLKEKVKVMQQIEYGKKKAEACREFCLVSSTTKQSGKTGPKIWCLKRMD
jgi:hypothetical protein